MLHRHAALLNAEAARDRYAELFDYAPIAFLAMDIAGDISEANLTARLMLDADADLSLALGSIFRYVTPEDAERLNACFQHVRSGRLRTHCQLTLSTAEGPERPVTAYLAVVPEPSAARLRMALVERAPPAA